MKRRTTVREIRQNAAKLVFAGYCGLQTLLINHSPDAYTCGMYGWNFDVYEVYGTTICTGYRGMPGRRANGIMEYERRAQEVINNDNLSRNERSQAIEELLKEFVKQA